MDFLAALAERAAPIAKAVTAALTAFSASLLTVQADGLTATEIVGVIVTTLMAGIATYAVPNRTDPKE
jgi:hypothetical protein